MCLLSFLPLPSRLSLVSVVFNLNASLNDVAPVSPILLTVDVIRIEESELLVDVFFMSLSSSLLILSFLSVVFDFNASLNDFAPVSPILLPVDVMRIEKSELSMDVFCLSSFFCLHKSD